MLSTEGLTRSRHPESHSVTVCATGAADAAVAARRRVAQQTLRALQRLKATHRPAKLERLSRFVERVSCCQGVRMYMLDPLQILDVLLDIKAIQAGPPRTEGTIAERPGGTNLGEAEPEVSPCDRNAIPFVTSGASKPADKLVRELRNALVSCVPPAGSGMDLREFASARNRIVNRACRLSLKLTPTSVHEVGRWVVSQAYVAFPVPVCNVIEALTDAHVLHVTDDSSLVYNLSLGLAPIDLDESMFHPRLPSRSGQPKWLRHAVDRSVLSINTSLEIPWRSSYLFDMSVDTRRHSECTANLYEETALGSTKAPKRGIKNTSNFTGEAVLRTRAVAADAADARGRALGRKLREKERSTARDDKYQGVSVANTPKFVAIAVKGFKMHLLLNSS